MPEKEFSDTESAARPASVESIIHNRQQTYYGEISESTAFIEFMLSAIKATFAETAEVKEKPLGKNVQNAALRRKFVLDFLDGHPHIMNADVCEGLGVSTATANLWHNGTIERVRLEKYGHIGWRRRREADGMSGILDEPARRLQFQKSYR